MDIALIILQFLLIATIGAVLWQLWKYLHSDLLPNNEPLGEERAKYITDRLDWLKYLLIAEVVVFVIRTVLQTLERIE